MTKRGSSLVFFGVALLLYLAVVGIRLEAIFGALGCLLMMIAGVLIMFSAKEAARRLVPSAVGLLALSALWPTVLSAGRRVGRFQVGRLSGNSGLGEAASLLGMFGVVLMGAAMLWLFALLWSRMPPRAPTQPPRLRERALVHRDPGGSGRPAKHKEDEWDLNLLPDDESHD